MGVQPKKPTQGIARRPHILEFSNIMQKAGQNLRSEISHKI